MKKKIPFVLFYYCVKYFTTHLFYTEVETAVLRLQLPAWMQTSLSNQKLLHVSFLTGFSGNWKTGNCAAHVGSARLPMSSMYSK